MRIARVIEEVDPNYKANFFEIASDTSPTYWLRSAKLNAPSIAEKVICAVQFRATIDPKIAKHQRFVVDLYELDAIENVKQLQLVANTQGTLNKEAILAVSHDTIFCIIGTRTYLSGGATHETTETLKRFRHLIVQAIETDH